MAKILNSNFASVFTTEDKEIIPEDSLRRGGLRPWKLTQYLRKTWKSIWINSTRTSQWCLTACHRGRLLKELKQQICTPLLTNTFNRSLQENKVPEDWKIANVTPIYKKGDKSVALNYRPINLTKIFEKIIRDKLVNFLEENNIISDSTVSEIIILA